MKDILVGVDGSPAWRHALDRALHIGQLSGRTVRLLNVFAPPAPRSATLGIEYLYDPCHERVVSHPSTSVLGVKGREENAADLLPLTAAAHES